MEERLNALEIALKNEMNEHHFYLKNAERTANPVGKAMFAQIASEELEHYERLKQLADNWKKDKKWPETVPLKVKDTASPPAPRHSSCASHPSRRRPDNRGRR